MEKLLKIKDQYFDLIKNDTFDYQKFNQFAIVHHSNAVEGSTLTIEETFLLLDKHLTPNSKPLEHTLMAIDHLDALKFVVELANQKTLLTADLLQKISSLAMKSTGSKTSSMAGDFDLSKGDFRKLTVRAGTTTFMDYKKVPQLVADLLQYINENIDAYTDFEAINKLAFEAHYQLVTIHPFADGNGRMSRLLMNYVQQFHGFPLSVVFQEDKTQYINALQETRQQEDLSVFTDFMFQQTEKFLQQQIATLTKSQNTGISKSGFQFLF